MESEADGFVWENSEEPDLKVVVQELYKSNPELFGEIEGSQQKLIEIKKILDEQSIEQYKSYALEQFPKDKNAQETLIKDLQLKYFEHYVTDVMKSQSINQRDQICKAHKSKLLDEGVPVDESFDGIYLFNLYFEAIPVPAPLIPVKIWIRKDLAEFKKEILNTQKECCIKIGSLSSASIRVPTHLEGSCIYWEFATDHYDVGFGLYFEWGLQTQDSITVHINDSSDEEGLDEFDESDAGEEITENNPDAELGGDFETGDGKKRRNSLKLPTDELLPISRRDSHQEVYCGCHTYPGCGTYILKFDNSFSLIRSKWLYYRVYYSK